MGNALAAAAFARADAAEPRARQRAWFSLPPISRTPMAAPPAITIGNASSMPGTPAFYSAGTGSIYHGSTTVSDRIVLTRGHPAAGASDASPSFDHVTVNAAGQTNGAGSFSFVHTGQAFELHSQASTTGNILVRIDDRYIDTTPTTITTGSGSEFFARYDFGTVGTRRIDVIAGLSAGLLGVNVGAGDGLDPAPVRGPRCIVLTDSFGANVTGPSFIEHLADGLGWDDVWNSGVGGTGYLNRGPAGVNFLDRVEHDVIGFAPDVVVFAGSRNDETQDVVAVQANALACFRQIRAALPDCMIFAGDMASQGCGSWPAAKLDKLDALAAAVRSVGGFHASPLENPLFAASGVAPHGQILDAPGAGGIGANGIVIDAVVPFGATIELGTGAVRERLHVTGLGVSGVGRRMLFDGTTRYAHVGGEPWRQVGGSYMTGNGSTATPAGFGTADLYTGSDGVHPTALGALALGRAWAVRMRQEVRAAGL